jgi:hypothetical protein
MVYVWEDAYRGVTKKALCEKHAATCPPSPHRRFGSRWHTPAPTGVECQNGQDETEKSRRQQKEQLKREFALHLAVWQVEHGVDAAQMTALLVGYQYGAAAQVAALGKTVQRDLKRRSRAVKAITVSKLQRKVPTSH